MRQVALAPAAEAMDQSMVLTFQVAGKHFAVDLDRVERILGYQPPTRTPRRPPFIEGVMEHRGRFFPVVSLRKRFGVAEAGGGHPAILILTGVGQDPGVGLAVDQVLRVLSVPTDAVLAPPPKVFGIHAEFIRGIANAGGRAIVWLDPARLLASAEPITLLV